MIFADKLITLRKKSGWSQEELAEKLGVTRQSVSKWEGAQSVPDLEKMLRLATIFGVTTDYLLRDEIESDGTPLTDVSEGRHITLADASAFLAAKDRTAKRIALATYLCILSPVPMFILAAGSQSGRFPITENAAGGIGMIVLLILIAIAVVLFLSCRTYTRDYDYLENESFDAEYGVEGMARERKKQGQERYSRFNIIGVCLCILSIVPLFAGAVFTEADYPMVLMLSLMFVIVGAGVACFILVGVPRESLDKLLQEGDYARDKKGGKLSGAVTSAYWMVVTAGYLAYSFITNDWERSWIVWPVAGVLFGAVMAVCHGIENRDK